MKKLLTTITLSALVGISASNLKPVFTNNIVSRGLKSNQLNKDGGWPLITGPFLI